MPSSGVSRCRTIVAGTGVPSGAGKVRVSHDVVRRGRGRGASCRCRSVRSPVREVDVGPDHGVHVGLVGDGDGGGLEVLVVGLGRPCPTRRAGRPRCRGSRAPSIGSTRSRCRTCERKVSTAWVAKASTRSSRSSGSSGRTGSQARWSWSASRGTGQRASRNSWASSLVTRRRVSVPSGSTACSAWYSTPGRRPPTDRGGSRGRCVSSTQTSRVSRLSDQITTSPPLRVARTFSSKRSSGSSSTSTSSSYDVPIACRQTWKGR